MNNENGHNELIPKIMVMVEKIRDEAVTRINDLRSAETERVNQMFESQKEYFNTIINVNKQNTDEKIETNKQYSDTKFDANKILNESILTERDAKLKDKFESLATAIDKAEKATEKRFESVNEFRSTLNDQQKTFLTASEYKSAHQNLVDLVNASNKTVNDTILTQKERIDKIENVKQGSSNVWIIIVGVIGFATGLISFILNLLGK
jgi:hypothetical protein